METPDNRKRINHCPEKLSGLLDIAGIEASDSAVVVAFSGNRQPPDNHSPRSSVASVFVALLAGKYFQKFPFAALGKHAEQSSIAMRRDQPPLQQGSDISVP